jgi:hypothetical protein
MIVIASLSFFQVVLFLHIAAVVLAFGVTFAYPIIGTVVQKTAPRSLPGVHRAQVAVGQRLITPMATLVLLTGIYLAAKYPGGNVFSEWWVSFPLLAILVILGLAGAFFIPHDRRMAELAERDVAAAGSGEVALSAEYEGLAKRVAIVGTLTDVLILAVIFVMVVGPTI